MLYFPVHEVVLSNVLMAIVFFFGGGVEGVGKALNSYANLSLGLCIVLILFAFFNVLNTRL